uniref:Homeobox domain-containing protein n=1 Tax=Biomphalaria glabrata TaxID=6526 RepID=A0A2C9JZE8_BIOGL
MVNGDNSDGQQPPKKAKRNRTSYTETQIKFLQDRFLRDSNPDGGELEKIAKHIGLKKRVVQVWFQNNRARLKKSANNNKGSNQENKNPSTKETSDVVSVLASYSHPVLFLFKLQRTFDTRQAKQSEGEEESPQFSDLSTPVLTAAGDSSTEDLPASSYHDFSSLGCPGGSGTRHIPLLSALKSTVMGAGLDKFTDSLALRGETQDPPQSSGRLFHDGALSRPLHHSESAFSSSHLGLYAGFYNSNIYHSRESLLGDPAVGAEGFLRHRDPQNMSYLGANQNSMFGHDPTSGPLRGQDSPQFPQLFNYLSGYGRSSCPSPPLPRSQGLIRFGLYVLATGHIRFGLYVLATGHIRFDLYMLATGHIRFGLSALPTAHIRFDLNVLANEHGDSTRSQ